MPFIVFIGPPGAGKGTQSSLLADRMGLPHLSTGEMLREIIAEQTALSRWLASRLDRGHFAPDHFAIPMVAERISRADCSRGCILDGFPRTLPQAQLLGELLDLDLAIELQVAEADLVDRLVERGRRSRRPDDSRAAISERLEVYQSATAPVVEYFSQLGRLETVRGSGSAESVAESIE
ncbi:MAG TPA: adenylate kinase, partial [Planctomycetaceae bacterium]|nr:adenylate kinase [Planctomycetaceae bacterium]